MRHFSQNWTNNLKTKISYFYSQVVTTKLVDQVVEGHADEVLAMKDRVEEMWSTLDSKRLRRSTATAGAPGVSLYADNVGMFQSSL